MTDFVGCRTTVFTRWEARMGSADGCGMGRGRAQRHLDGIEGFGWKAEM